MQGVYRTFSTQAAVALLAIVLAPLPAGAAAFEVPSPEEIFQRVFAANIGMSGVVTADAVFKLRVNKPLSAPPDCVFHGITRYEKGRQIVTIERRTAGMLCWELSAINPQFEARQALEDVLRLLDITVLGMKLVGNDRYYLIRGKARDPKTVLREFILWVDYDRGLLTEGTLTYQWGSIDVEQEYAPLNGGWVLTHQYLYTSRFHASMEVSYSNFRV